jgi:Ca-activated chloride channel family protein
MPFLTRSKNMDEAKLKKILSDVEVPKPDENARKMAINLAVAEFKALEEARKNAPQGFSFLSRLMGRTNTYSRRRDPMELRTKQRLMYGGLATAMAVILVVGVTTQQTIFSTVGSGTAVIGGDAAMNRVAFVADDGSSAGAEADVTAPPGTQEASPAYIEAVREENEASRADAAQGASSVPAPMEAPVGRLTVQEAKKEQLAAKVKAAPYPSQSQSVVGGAANRMAYDQSAEMMIAPTAPPPGVVMPYPMPEPVSPYYQDEGRDKFQDFKPSPVKMVSQEPVSTFSIDVDTAAYSVVRRQLNMGSLPHPDAVRVEELVNYFDYNYPLPETREQPFKPSVTVVDSPWNAEKKLVHIGIKGFDIDTDRKPHSNLVFLVDVSGSMDSPDKLPLVKSSLKMLLDTLQPNDTIALTVYAGSAGTVLEPTKVSDKAKIIAAIDNLNAGGSTAGAAGIAEAYRLAEQHFDKEGVNRVIIASDGDFNVGASSDEELKAIIEKKRESGIFLSVLGFGMGNLNDSLMQTLAQNGNGSAAYIDTLNEARKVLVDEASSTLFPIAKDVKIQVEFNPALVQEYRLVGYETRALNREDFNNDKIDAGDIGAGHAVTAIYEITPVGAKATIDPSRYAAKEETAKPATDSQFANELGFLKMRYKLPNGTESKLITTPITTDSKGADIQDVNWSIAVAGFAQLLKNDNSVQSSYTYDSVIEQAQRAKSLDEFGQRAEFISLVRLAKSSSPQ